MCWKLLTNRQKVHHCIRLNDPCRRPKGHCLPPSSKKNPHSWGIIVTHALDGVLETVKVRVAESSIFQQPERARRTRGRMIILSQRKGSSTGERDGWINDIVASVHETSGVHLLGGIFVLIIVRLVLFFNRFFFVLWTKSCDHKHDDTGTTIRDESSSWKYQEKRGTAACCRYFFYIAVKVWPQRKKWHRMRAHGQWIIKWNFSSSDIFSWQSKHSHLTGRTR